MALYEVLFHFKTGISKSRYFKGGIFDLLVQRFSNSPQIQYGTISIRRTNPLKFMFLTLLN